ncbi:MAG: hypothetical protein IJ160_02015 [Muribaculaceae bacterium]|nr:hypothetical protein [Muribaculaceae bacterium]
MTDQNCLAFLCLFGAKKAKNHVFSKKVPQKFGRFGQKAVPLHRKSHLSDSNGDFWVLQSEREIVL